MALIIKIKKYWKTDIQPIWTDEKTQKDLLDDIKTTFDSLKNLGLCVGIALGLQYLQVPMSTAGMSQGWRVFVNWVAMSLVIFLTGLAMAWMVLNFKSKPSSKFMHISSLVIYGIITVVAMLAVIFASFKNVPFTF